MNLSALLLSGLFWAGAQAAFAHDTFFLPAPPTVSGDWVVDLGSATHFPALQTPVRPERASGLTVAQRDVVLPFTTEATPAALRVIIPRPADRAHAVVARIAFEPRDIDVPPAEVDEYMTEIGASPELHAAFKAASATGAARETYAKVVKAYLCEAACIVEDAPVPGGRMDFFPAPGGFALRGPSGPVAGQAVFLSTTDGRRRALTTDADGQVAIPPDVAGLALLTAVALRAPASEVGRFTSDWAALTFTAGTIRAR